MPQLRIIQSIKLLKDARYAELLLIKIMYVLSADIKNKIYRVVLDDKLNYIDITEPINKSLYDDLRRRDFTINAIAINLKNNEIIDINIKYLKEALDAMRD